MFDVRNFWQKRNVNADVMNECNNQVGTSERKKGADYALESIHNMKEALPELWEEAEKDEDVKNSSKVGIETSVIA